MEKPAWSTPRISAGRGSLPEPRRRESFDFIVLLGFPKSGTSSFHWLFKQLGFESHHLDYHRKPIAQLMIECHRRGRNLLDFIPSPRRKPVCLTQIDCCMVPGSSFWPQITLLEELTQQYPNTLYILNTRDPKNLLRSFLNWGDYLGRIFRHNPELFVDIPAGPQDRRFLALVDRHHRNVRRHFARHSELTLLEFDIERDSVDRIAEFIDLQGISEFPWWNRTKG